MPAVDTIFSFLRTLRDATIRVIRTASGIRFFKKKIKRIVPYNCGICY